MCLILFSFDATSPTPFIAAANRDEFFERPTAAAQYWQEHPHILAGQDLVGGGTWMGITTTGRFAAVTNVREPGVVVEDPLSRGELTRGFLSSEENPRAFLQAIEPTKMRYSGFNLLVGEFTENKRELFYLSNRQEGIVRLATGIYGLSNHLLDSHWPKVENGKRFLQQTLEQQNDIPQYHQTLRRFLEDDAQADDRILPQTGVSYDWEKALSAAFINTLPHYGTRTSTVLTISEGSTYFSEKNYRQGEDTNDNINMFHLPTGDRKKNVAM